MWGCGISIADAMEIVQSCTEPQIWSPQRNILSKWNLKAGPKDASNQVSLQWSCQDSVLVHTKLYGNIIFFPRDAYEQSFNWNEEHTSMDQCKKDVTPLLMHWSYVFLALTHRMSFALFLHSTMVSRAGPSQVCTKYSVPQTTWFFWVAFHGSV